MRVASPDAKLIFVGDVHLDHGDEALPDFLSFLEGVAIPGDRVVLMGDLFNIWIGRRELEGEHHHAVACKLIEMRARGISTSYIEGNRDYRIGDAYRGTAFDEVTDGGIAERCGERSIFAIHGDLTNRSDFQYRTWRRVSRSTPFWTLFHLIPVSLRRRLAESTERRMRGTNLSFKREFPSEVVKGYAASWLERGHDEVVLGHFHVERKLPVEKPPGRVWVLPEWKGSRRHLECTADGGMDFVDSRC